MERNFYIHMSYQTSDGGSRNLNGDSLVKIDKPTTMRELRQYIIGLIKADPNVDSGIQWQIPTIISMNEISKELYETLHGTTSPDLIPNS